MTDTTVAPKIESETELFDQLANRGVSKVEVRYGNDDCCSLYEGSTAWDEVGNKIDLVSEIGDAARELADERVEYMEWRDHEDKGDDWATVTFDVKERRVDLKGETVKTITTYEGVETFKSWEPDA